MTDPLNTFAECYRDYPFPHAEEIFEGLAQGTVRLVQVSEDIPCGLYAEMFAKQASHLEVLDPCPEPQRRDEWRTIATNMANAPGDESCREWRFVGDRYSFRVYEIRSHHAIAGCEKNDMVAAEEQLAKFAAIGVTFSIDAVREVFRILADERFEFGAEGTGVSGYELYTAKETASEAVELLRKSGIVEKHSIEIYHRARSANEGTRYDRLLDHVIGEDPDRPSYTGIQFNI